MIEKTGLSALRDPIQEFAERVAGMAEKWFDVPRHSAQNFAALIASELQAGGWTPAWTNFLLEETANGGRAWGRRTNEYVTLARQTNPSDDIGCGFPTESR